MSKIEPIVLVGVLLILLGCVLALTVFLGGDGHDALTKHLLYMGDLVLTALIFALLVHTNKG